MNARRLIPLVLAALCAPTGALALVAPASAKEVLVYAGSFGEAGSGPGQLDEPLNLAINDTTHDVYVSGHENNHVTEYASSGEFIREFGPPGGFRAPGSIAVDNSGNALDQSNGDVYVIDVNPNVIYKFTENGEFIGKITQGGHGSWTSERETAGNLAGITVTQSGVLWAVLSQGFSGETFLESFDSAQTNTLLQSSVIAGKSSEKGHIENKGAQENTGLAIDSEGDFYMPASNNVAVFGPNLEFIREDAGPGVGADEQGFAVDEAADELYVSSPGQATKHKDDVIVYPTGKDSDGIPLEEFGSEQLSGKLGGVAVDPVSNEVYEIDQSTDKIFIYKRILVPDVSTGGEPTGLEREGTVTLDGIVNPDGVPVSGCVFEYGPSESYGQTAPCEESPGSGREFVPVHATISGLTPLAHYHYRLVASNAQGADDGFDESFFAPTRPSVDDESVTGVAAGAATLRAEVDPGGADTTYRFEYGPTTAYGFSAPSPEGAAGASVSPGEVSVRLQDLLPGTVYHFRVVASNALQREVAGVDEQFSTQPAGTEFTLPDGRQWELVTPPNKHGAGIFEIGYQQGAYFEAADNGDGITYATSAPIVAEPPGNRAIEPSQALSRRGPDGWETEDITTPNTEAGNLIVGSQSEYKLFSEDLSLGLVEPRGESAIAPLPAGSEKTPYLRHTANGEYEALLTSANTPPGAAYGKQSSGERGVLFEGASPDLSHVVLQSPEVPLVAGETGATLYEWTAGRLKPVSVLPASEGGNGVEGTLGNNQRMFAEGKVARHSVSNDGARVVWSGRNKGEHLYLRDTEKEETVRVDTPEGVEAQEGSPLFVAANGEGTRIFFTEYRRLLPDASQGGRDLYVFEVTSHGGEPLKGKLTDLTADQSEPAGVQGEAVGVSEDGTYVYFVAAGVLGDGAEHGAVSESCEYEEANSVCNLYVEHYDGSAWEAPRFIATLSEAQDADDWARLGTGFKYLTARVSPNGRYLAFMSDLSPTGYDNLDVNSGKPDEEVYLYDAQSGRLVCASCNPTGERPVGMFDQGGFDEVLVDYTENWKGRWLAASVPGWDNVDLQDALYQSRYLSNNGRLFFDSVDPLVPADVNGKENVYEYEPEGVGTCSSGSGGSSIVYSQRVGGCVALISSGTSSEESAFLDADEGGGNVFFLTTSQLSPQDYDNAYDIYDAHECTAASPCPPSASVAPPPCTTAEACRAAPTPQPSIFGSPSSATFSGAGNVVPTAPQPNTTTLKSVSRAQKLAAALRACREQARRRRAVCEARARRSYRVHGARAKKKGGVRKGSRSRAKR